MQVSRLPTVQCPGCGKLAYTCTLRAPFSGCEFMCKRCCNKLRARVTEGRSLPDSRDGLRAMLAGKPERQADPPPKRAKGPPSPRPWHQKIQAETQRTRRAMLRRWRHYERGAKAYGRPFELTRHEFAAMWQQPCTYCSRPIATIGIDRIDNDVGYITSNCIPCCWPCNKSKGATPVKQWLENCGRVAQGPGIDGHPGAPKVYR